MSETLQEFLQAAEAWVCDEYSLDVRYIALSSGRGYEILSASILLNPLKAKEDNSFGIDTGSLLAGQIQRFPIAKEEVIQILNDASHGLMRVDGKQLHLPRNAPHSHYSDSANRDTWFSPLHLKTTGGTAAPQSRTQLHARDSELRVSTPPFDGLTDLFAWLGLDATPLAGRPSSIDVRIGPPVDIILGGCKLSGDRLRLVLHAHPSLDANRVRLAIRSVPGGGIAGRIQAATRLSWATPADSRREAIANIDVPNSDSALVVLMVGSATVRRQWFIDPAKARNNRLLAVQHFDTELRKVREAVLSTSESRRFEQGIASLLYVLGFSPVVQIETDSPDLIVSTPAGRLMLLECTLRIADFSEKIGKLVDRRGSLIKSLRSSGHFSQVVAVLVCRLPRDQIPAKDEELRSHGIVLVVLEDIAGAFDRVRHGVDPDELIEAEIAKLSSSVT